ncbi:MAG TPA: aspartate-semialdehyde dehydrogenase, partial [Clostridiales bacterium]|nr:aspartate-semialdehyde dehydrogenase [Clostridiales bacterium]
EEKSEKEPLKVWGKVVNGAIISATEPMITAQCIRVPVSDGHLATVFVTFKKKPTKDEIICAWRNYRGKAQELDLPLAPKQFI